MSRLRVALFVEGSQAPPSSRQADPLSVIWNDDLAGALEIERFEVVIPISKKHIVAMDSDAPKMSGASEGLDQLIVRKMNQTAFDAAVVAWDLVPAWNPEGRFCPWDEIKNFYSVLSISTVLPAGWRDTAKLRYEELAARAWPGERLRLPRIEKDAITAVCMDPMFEGLLVQDEQAAKRALGVANLRIPNWPSTGWGDNRERHPDNEILKPALTSLQKLRPKPRILKQIRGDFVTNKTGWGECLLRKYLQEPTTRQKVLEHPICIRLREILK